MRFFFAASVIAGLLLSNASANPFGPGRSDDVPTTKKAKPENKSKKAKPADDEEIVIEDAPAKKAKPSKPAVKAAAKPAPKKAKPADDELLVIEEDAPTKAAPAKKSKAIDENAPAKSSKKSKPVDEHEAPTKVASKKSKVIDEDAPAKSSKKSKAIDDEDEAPTKVTSKRSKAVDDAPAKKSKLDDDDDVRATIASKPSKVDSKTSKANTDEVLVIEEDTPAKQVVETPVKRPLRAKRSTDDADEADDESDDAEKPVAALDDDDDSDVDTIPAVTKTAAKPAPHKTRFYFRAGAMKQSTKLGETQFSLQTDLPVDTSSLGGGGSGVETQQSQVPVGAIIGVVLPVASRKLSIETVLGIPSPTKFKATGKLANESLAPTFQGMPTGIQPLGPDLGEVTFAPPIVTAVYRVAKLGPVTPIAGAGLMVLMGRNAKITNAVLQEAGDPKLSIKPSPGLVVQGGLDIQLWKRVAARVDVKYVLGMKVNATIEDIAVTPTAIPALGSIEVGDAVMSAKVAPLIVQAGVGVDF